MAELITKLKLLHEKKTMFLHELLAEESFAKYVCSMYAGIWSELVFC